MSGTITLDKPRYIKDTHISISTLGSSKLSLKLVTLVSGKTRNSASQNQLSIIFLVNMKKLINYSLLSLSLLLPLVTFYQVVSLPVEARETLSSIINRCPVISNKVFYYATKNKPFSYFIAITDRENDQVTSKIIGNLPSGVNRYCNSAGCYIYGTSSQIGIFPFRIEAIDSEGNRNVNFANLVVTAK